MLQLSLQSRLSVPGQLIEGKPAGHLEMRDVTLGDFDLCAHFLHLLVDQAQLAGERVGHLLRGEKPDFKKLVVREVDL